MAHENYDELSERMLDEVSDSEFGAVPIRDRLHPGASEDKAGDLASWTAQDFSSIYIRFRPHLVRHAQRYLSNVNQAEEVVQDAFLYLMTTLPELDSELGVLKFLKWKIKLLAYDLHRLAATKKEFTGIDVADETSDIAPIDEQLERAEDVAVIKLALAKLNPRQRAAIVATVYEEKTHEELAQQLGLTTNGARQLLFRARSAFRKALVGEAEISGKSVSEILSIAAKKAATNAPGSAVRVSAMLLAGFAVVAGLQNLGTGDATVTAEPSPVVEGTLGDSTSSIGDSEQSNETFTEDLQSGPANTGDESSGQSDDQSQPEISPVTEIPLANADSRATIESTGDVTVGENTAGVTTPAILGVDAGAVMNTSLPAAGMYINSYPAEHAGLFQGTSIEVFAGTGISAFLDYSSEDIEVQKVIFQLNAGQTVYFAQTRVSDIQKRLVGSIYEFDIEMSDFYFFDSTGSVYSDIDLSKSAAKISLRADEFGEPLGASMYLTRLD